MKRPLVWAYFDTSALVKRYVKEEGSPRVRVLFKRYRFLSSAITPLELVSALCRRRATGELAEKDYRAILSRMEEDRAYWELIEVSPRVLERAEELIQQTALRTLDAIHIASALMFQSAFGIRVPFITGDARQSETANQLAMHVVEV